jgi:hypothetical protein
MKIEGLPDLLQDVPNSSAIRGFLCDLAPNHLIRFWSVGAYSNTYQLTHRYSMASAIARSQSRQILPVVPSEGNRLPEWRLIKVAATERQVPEIYSTFRELFLSDSSLWAKKTNRNFAN